MLTTTELQSDTISKTINLAVVPLVNMSADINQEYFSDSVSEDIIDALIGIEGFKMISRNSSFGLKDNKMTVEEIGQFLNIDFVVTGTLRRIGSKVRMRVFLHNTSTGEEIWGESYDRKLVEIFDIQEEIVNAICVNLLPETVNEGLKRPLMMPTTKNLKAYDLYAQGLFFHNKWSIADLSKAVVFYEKAVKKEPEYYKAYSMKANAIVRLSFTGGYDVPVKSYDEARLAAETAIKINPEYYRSYIALCYVFLYHKYDWEQALMMVNKALKMNQFSTRSLVAKSLYYSIKGKFHDSRKLLRQALEIDPLSFMAKRAKADNYFLEGKYETAIEIYDRLLEIDPTHEKVLEYKGWSIIMQGKLDEAIDMFKTLDMKTALAIKSYSQIGYAYGIKGDIENANKYLGEIEKSAFTKKGLTYAMDMSVVYAGMGEQELAMDRLEEAVENKRSGVIYLKVHPVWDPLRSNTRFKSLLRRLRLD